MNVKLLLRMTAQMYHSRGFRGVFTKIHEFILFSASAKADPFDLKRGTSTSGNVPLWRCHITSHNAQHGIRYQATGEAELVAAIAFLKEDLREFTFVDLGCGKGRALVVATELGFGAVLGVEFARELVDTAKNNLRTIGARSASIIHGDAAEFQFPNGDLVVFLYNPFGRPVIERVAANLARSDAAKLYVIYQKPVHAAQLDASGLLEFIGSPPGYSDICVWRRRLE